jgi:ribosomal protein S18 acetylase RimI-like enzyme
MITYTHSLEDVTPDHLRGGFFVGWPNPPSPETHYRILANSYKIVLARNIESMVVGFVTSVSDGVSAAYIPHLEVLPVYQKRGIGSELVRRLLNQLGDLYMIDLVCDPQLQPYYERFGMHAITGMVLRNYERQSGAPIKPNEKLH